MSKSPILQFSTARGLTAAHSRRDVFRLMALGGALVLLPSALTACSDDPTGPQTPGSGDPLTIDFALGDVAVLQFAYVLEQLEADFYVRTVNAFDDSDLSAAEKAVIADIKNHEVMHRALLRSVLGSTYGFTVDTTFPAVNFRSRTSVLATARTFEDLGVAAYNGAAQYLTSTDTLTLAGKIVSVEARHASAIRDLIAPKSGEFAPDDFDDAFRPATVASAAQGFIVDELTFANAPAVFVQGPNNNG